MDENLNNNAEAQVANANSESQNDDVFADVEEMAEGIETQKPAEEGEGESATNEEANKTDSQVVEKGKKGQKDSSFAAQRREKERQFNERINKEKEEAYAKGKVEAFIGLNNTFTNEVINDIDDAQTFLKMVECQKAGHDPLTEMYKYDRERIAKQRIEETKKQSEQEWFKSDKQDFENKYPDVDLNNLIEDDLFKKFAQNKLGKLPMSTIYEDYNLMNSLIEARANAEISNKVNKSKNSPGPLNTTPPKQTLDFETMSKDDFEEYRKKVNRGELMKF